MTNKVVIIGASAAGKTTFAHALNKKMNLPLTLMDEVQWNPGWEYIGDEKVIDKLNEISIEPKWMIEGYISTTTRTHLFDRAEKIIYLDYSGYLIAWRYIKRVWKHRENPRAELPGSPDSFNWAFLKLVFTKGETLALEQLFEENNWKEKIVRLQTPKQVEEYIKNI